MADITIIRNGTRISLANFPKLGSGSENIAVAVSASGDYDTYTTELYYGWYQGSSMQKMLAQYQNGLYYIPSNALFNAGNVYLTLRLVSGGNKVSTNTIPITIEKSAVNNEYSILPATETWQKAVDNYLNNSINLLNERFDNLNTKVENEIPPLRNRLDNLVANTGNSNSEIVDARLGYDGTTYSTLGTAIRSQVDNLNKDLSNVKNDIYQISYGYEKITDGLTKINGYGITKISDTSFTIEKQNDNMIGYPVKAGDKVKISGDVYPNYNAVGYVLATTTNVPSEWNGSNSLPMLSATENDYFCGNTEKVWKEYEIELTIPNGAKMILVRGVKPSISLYKAIYEPNVYTKEETDSKINSLKENSTKDVYTINTIPTVTTGTVTKQHVFSKENRDSFLWEFSKVGSLKIPNVQVNATENDVVGIWVYCNQEMLTQPNNTDGIFKVYVDDIQYKKISTAYTLHVGWNYIKLGIKDSNVHTVKFDFTLVRGNYKFAIDTIELNYRTRTQVLLSFDMSSSAKRTVYTKRFPLVDSYGFKATFCNPNDANISDEQLNEMWKKGWDWSTYGGEGTRPNYDTGTVDEWVEYLNTRINACAERGLFNPISYFSPDNRSSVVLEQALKKLGFKIARVACSGNYYLDWFDDKNGIYIYTFGVGGTETAENTLAVLDKAIETGTSICIFTHDVEDELSNNMNCTTEVYTAILEGIKERVDKGLCDVVTFREFYQHWCPEGYAELMENRHEKEKQYILNKIEAN